MYRVPTEDRTLSAYKGVGPQELLGQVEELARGLKGLRVVHVNATPGGGGVAEILRSLVPLMKDAGANAEWYVPDASAPFFKVTKTIHNLLQGNGGRRLSKAALELYVSTNLQAAQDLEASFPTADILVIHDPQFLPLRSYLRHRCADIWVCHIDTTHPNQEMMKRLLPYICQYDRMVFSLDDYVLPALSPQKVKVFPPAIDPFSPKNLPSRLAQAKNVLAGLGIDPSRPLITQVSRFDIWKDPWGVVDAYRMAKEEIPDLQLALVGVFDAQDDPEAEEVYGSVKRHCGGDKDIHLFTDPNLVKAREVNAFQRASGVIIQKSTREGFGLTVAEAMWQGTPVVGGNCGGIRHQIRDGETGFLVDDPSSCASRIVQLLRDPSLARRIGRAGKASVAERFLMLRLLRDYLLLFSDLLAEGRHQELASSGLGESVAAS